MARALIIESDAALAKSLTRLLGHKGVETQITADGTEGVNVARSFSPDVIILCVELSRVSGYSICNKLKKDPELGRIPLILTSSQATEETFEQHKKLKTRAEAYLKKPYSDAEIMALLGPYVGAGGGEADVGLDEVSVDVDDAGVTGGSSAAAQFGLDVDEPVPRAAPRPAPRAATSATAVTRPVTAVAAAGADSQAEPLRAENRQLRQKLQKLEETLNQKELEFNDRLLEESSRGREGIDAKKRLQALEREVARHREQAERAQAELEEARRDLGELRLTAKSGDSEKQVMATKIGQLVDKVKALAAERDAAQQEIDRLSEAHASTREETDNAARVRDKARKAVDIAIQLIDDTGLLP